VASKYVHQDSSYTLKVIQKSLTKSTLYSLGFIGQLLDFQFQPLAIRSMPVIKHLLEAFESSVHVHNLF